MSSMIFMNGEFVKKENAKISVYDHGLLYGDGIYEGLRCYSGHVFQLSEHLERLEQSARSLRINIPYSSEQIKYFILETLRQNNLHNAYIRLVITRGVGAMGPDPRTCIQPNVIIITEDLPNVHGTSVKEKGLSLVIVSTRRDSVEGTSHEIKSLNYLNSIMARMEANEYNADDAILLDPQGFISESTICNIFMVSNKKLITPCSSNGILKGITRQVVMSIAKEMGLEIEERNITPHELINAKEIFLTGTHAEIVGVTRINNILIASGEIGRITKVIISKFREMTKNPMYGTPVYKTEVREENANA
ncbi:branched-chain-amino-acid transaminase [Bacillus sp. S10(2024)]|uniref:branched-chain-amino-acid transaminase n=1 Tax=Bacillus sp. S10(2024) TaxID=3162886 RepID=UPI003D1E60D3